jgi:hypothetical protein
VVQAEAGSRSSRALDSIARLTTRPGVVVALEWRDAPSVAALARAIRSAIDDHAVAGDALVPASVALEPRFVDACSEALARNPHLGILSGWTDHGPEGFAQPTPAFPYQWLIDGIGDAAVVRAEAFLHAGGLREHLPPRYAKWDLWNAIMVAGWSALAYPGVLARRGNVPAARHHEPPDAAVLRALRERFATAFAADAEAVRALEAIPGDEGPHPMHEVFRLPLRKQVELALDAVRQPRRALGWLKAHWSRVTR